MVTLNSGTATTRKLRGETYPCYNHLIIDNGNINVKLINTETGYKKEFARYSVEMDDDKFNICSYKHNLL